MDLLVRGRSLIRSRDPLALLFARHAALLTAASLAHKTVVTIMERQLRLSGPETRRPQFFAAVCLLFVLASARLMALDPALELVSQVGGGGNDIGLSSVADQAGNVYVVGMFEQSVDFDPGSGIATLTSAGGRDAFVASYDVSGNYRWAFRLGNTSLDEGISVALDANNDIVVVGHFGGTVDFDPGLSAASMSAGNSTSGADFIAKYTSSGNYRWAFQLHAANGSEFTDAAIDVDGNIIVTGGFWGTMDFAPAVNGGTIKSSNSQEGSMFVAKYTPNGAHVWAFKVDGGTSQYNKAYSSRIALDLDNNVYVTGKFTGTVNFNPAGKANLTSSGPNPSGSEGDMFIAKYLPGGAYAWAIRAGGTAGDAGQDVGVSDVGDIIVVGYFRGTVDIDPGVPTANLTSAGDRDIFVAKYSTIGKYLQAFRLGGTGSDFAYRIADPSFNGYLSITGQFTGTVDFNPGSGTATLTSTPVSLQNTFVVRFASDFGYSSAFSLGALSDCRDLAIDHSTGNLIATGGFSESVDFDPSIGTSMHTSAGRQDVYIARYSTAVPSMLRPRTNVDVVGEIDIRATPTID